MFEQLPINWTQIIQQQPCSKSRWAIKRDPVVHLLKADFDIVISAMEKGVVKILEVEDTA